MAVGRPEPSSFVRGNGGTLGGEPREGKVIIGTGNESLMFLAMLAHSGNKHPLSVV